MYLEKKFLSQSINTFVFMIIIAQLPSRSIIQSYTRSALFPHIQNDTWWNQLCSWGIQVIKMLFLCVHNICFSCFEWWSFLMVVPASQIDSGHLVCQNIHVLPSFLPQHLEYSPTFRRYSKQFYWFTDPTPWVNWASPVSDFTVSDFFFPSQRKVSKVAHEK